MLDASGQFGMFLVQPTHLVVSPKGLCQEHAPALLQNIDCLLGAIGRQTRRGSVRGEAAEVRQAAFLVDAGDSRPEMVREESDGLGERPRRLGPVTCARRFVAPQASEGDQVGGPWRHGAGGLAKKGARTAVETGVVRVGSTEPLEGLSQVDADHAVSRVRGVRRIGAGREQGDGLLHQPEVVVLTAEQQEQAAQVREVAQAVRVILRCGADRSPGESKSVHQPGTLPGHLPHQAVCRAVVVQIHRQTRITVGCHGDRLPRQFDSPRDLLAVPAERSGPEEHRCQVVQIHRFPRRSGGGTFDSEGQKRGGMLDRHAVTAALPSCTHGPGEQVESLGVTEFHARELRAEGADDLVDVGEVAVVGPTCPKNVPEAPALLLRGYAPFGVADLFQQVDHGVEQHRVLEPDPGQVPAVGEHRERRGADARSDLAHLSQDREHLFLVRAAHLRHQRVGQETHAPHTERMVGVGDPHACEEHGHRLGMVGGVPRHEPAVQVRPP
ncbi:hypothetical protein [Streptomyces sp. SAI-127]|uniref:hypothetical protein n=1 Tax=Streptomyces sp. SAI-127 TaxID=2940543 RepID=UPI002475C1D2|nr:hypothetical protein [Streptomyces sp. SAI-127]